MDLSPGEAPHQPRLHGPEEDVATLRPVPGAGHVLENPSQLGPGEVGVHLEPRLGQNGLPETAIPELLTEGMGPAVLPHDRVAQRLPRARVPDDGGLPLVGYAHGDALTGIYARPRQAVAYDAHAGIPDLGRIVLHHPRTRVDLPQGPLGHREDLSPTAEQHAADARCPGVQGEDESGHAIIRGRCRPG